MNVEEVSPLPSDNSAEDTQASTAPAEEAQPSEATTDANPAGSSAVDEGAKKEPDFSSVIRDAVKKEEPAADAPPAPEGDQEPKAEGEAEAETSAEEDDSKLPFHTHPRFKELVEERNSLREPAEQYGKITEFMQVHGLDGKEVAEGFSVMAALKSTDPETLNKAVEWFENSLQSLKARTGQVLPDDLQDRVDSGAIDEDDARELARVRAEKSLLETGREAEQERRQQSEVQQVQRDMMTAVQTWEAGIRQSDPDYAKKEKLVETTVRSIVQANPSRAPKNAAEARALAEEAYAEVNKLQAQLTPRPKPVDTTDPRTTTTRPATTAPKTLLDAVKGALVN